MAVVGDVLLVVLGAVLVLMALDAALRTFVLPRGSVVRVARIVAITLRAGFGLILRRLSTYERRDRLMAMYTPTLLFALVLSWMALVYTGFVGLFVVTDGRGWHHALIESGSSMFTLGFERPVGLPGAFAGFAEAAIGLGLLALLIGYLPTIYNAFSRRELLVAEAAVWAGSPPQAPALVIRANRIGRLDDLDDVWTEWRAWFNEVEESHTSLGMVSFLRSPRSDRSWITAAGAMLDAAALVTAVVDLPKPPLAAVLIRSGTQSLRAIADFFGIAHNPDPAPTDPISVVRDEFDEACARLAAAGVPLREDRDQAWRDFAGWRVNYDGVLVTLCGFLVAPYAPWSSDRSVAFRVRPLRAGAARR